MLRELGLMAVGAWLAACAGSGAARTGDTTPAAEAAPVEPAAPAPGATAASSAPDAGTEQAAAEPAPSGSCTVGKLETIPTELGRTDQCRGTFYCPGARTVEVACDGENDGTNTSLCGCEERGKKASVSKPVAGEAPDSCIAAAELCLTALGR